MNLPAVVCDKAVCLALDKVQLSLVAVGLRKGEFAGVLNVSFFDSVMATLINGIGYVMFFWSYIF